MGPDCYWLYLHCLRSLAFIYIFSTSDANNSRISTSLIYDVGQSDDVKALNNDAYDEIL